MPREPKNLRVYFMHEKKGQTMKTKRPEEKKVIGKLLNKTDIFVLAFGRDDRLGLGGAFRRMDRIRRNPWRDPCFCHRRA